MKKTLMFFLAGSLLAVGTPAVAQAQEAGQTVNIVYNYYYGGVQKASETLTGTVGAAYPEPTKLPDYVDCDGLPTGTVTAGGTYTLTCTLSADNPFIISSSYEQGTAVWYALSIDDSYNYFVSKPADGAELISLTEMILISKDENALDDYLWCFVGNPFEGYRIYNYNGGDKILAVDKTAYANDNNTGGNTHPLLYAESNLTDDYNKTWDVVASKVTDSNGEVVSGFHLVMHGESYATYSMNNRSNRLSFWTEGVDEGSLFTAYDAKALYEQQDIADLFNTTAEVAGAVGTYATDDITITGTTGDYAEHIQNFENNVGTWHDYAELCRLSYYASERVKLEPNGWYRIKNYNRKASRGNDDATGEGGYMEVVDQLENTTWTIEMVANDADDVRSLALWKFEATDEDGQFRLYSLNALLYAGSERDDSPKHYLMTATDTDAAGVFTVTSYGTGQSLIVCTQLYGELEADGSNDYDGAGILIGNDGAYSPSAWYIIPATTIDLTVTEAGWATMHYPFAVQLPDGLTAYAITSETTDRVYLSELGTSTIPAYTPVLLAGNPATYTLTLLPDNDDTAISTRLSGTRMYEEIPATTNAYVLSTLEGGMEVGFYQLETTDRVDNPDRVVAANKAYFVGTVYSSISMNFALDGAATGITTATSEATDAEKVYYDLNGRRVLYPSRGIYVTADGQKVFIK